MHAKGYTLMMLFECAGCDYMSEFVVKCLNTGNSIRAYTSVYYTNNVLITNDARFLFYSSWSHSHASNARRDGVNSVIGRYNM